MRLFVVLSLLAALLVLPVACTTDSGGNTNQVVDTAANADAFADGSQ